METLDVVDGMFAQLASEGSRRVYAAVWRRYTKWLRAQGIELLDARPRHIHAHLTYLRDQEMAKSTIGHALSVIREVYGALVREECLTVNPAREVKSPKLSSDPKAPWLSEEEVRVLLALPAQTWAERRDRVCVCLLLGLGWRRVEVARLRVEDFERAGDGWCVTGTVKGGKKLTAGVPEWVMKELHEWLDAEKIRSGPILPRGPEDARAVSGDQIYDFVVRSGARADLTVTPHALRRTNITLSGLRGVSLRARQLAVGHSSGATTERYDRARDASLNAPGQVLADLINKEKK